MKPADHSEPQQDTAHSLAASRAGSIQQPGTDILTPLASRSLFWRARYLEASPALCHIPLLFWLTETARPRIAVTLGVADAVPHFALCQAVDKLGLDSLCIGVEPVPEQDAKPADLAKQSDFNDANFAEFSRIVQDRPGKESVLPPEGKIDLLIINRPVAQDLIEALDTDWLPHLSERSIIVVLQDGEAPGYGSLFRHLSATGSSFTCDLESRASVIFHGSEQNDRLQRLASLKPGHPGYLAARNIFARLGELHSNAERLASKTRESRIARRQRDEKTAELTAAQAEAEKLFTQYRERSSLVATAQAEAFDLGQAVTKLEEELQSSQAKHQQEKDLLNKEVSTLKEALSTAEGERQKLQKLAAEQEEALSERQNALSALELKFETEQQEKDLLDEEASALRETLSTLQENLSTVEAERQKLQKLAAELEEALSERYKDISALGLELEARQQEKDLLGKEVSKLKEALGTAEAERGKLQKLAAEQEEALGERYNDIATLGLEIQAKTLEIQAKTEENRNLAAEVGTLKRSLSETEHLRDIHAERVHDLENSTSWRVTAPLRKASLTLKPR